MLKANLNRNKCCSFVRRELNSGIEAIQCAERSFHHYKTTEVKSFHEICLEM